jgi:hypothetical protein
VSERVQKVKLDAAAALSMEGRIAPLGFPGILTQLSKP